jgi:hypothetical protein
MIEVKSIGDGPIPGRPKISMMAARLDFADIPPEMSPVRTS